MTTRRHEVDEAERSLDIPPEAVAAVKLNRADAVKLVAAAMIDIAGQDLAGAEQAVIRARDAFREAVCNRARVAFGTTLTIAAKALGHTNADGLHAACTYCVYEDGSDSGDTAQVIFSDHQQSFEAKLRLEVTVKLDEAMRRAAQEWLCRLSDAKVARERDVRVGAMKKEARELLIKSALDSTDEGKAVVAAVRALAASLKKQS